MKKITMILAMAIVSALCIGCLVACGGESGVAGTYRAYGIEVAGEEYTFDNLPEGIEDSIASLRDFNIVIKSDGKATCTMFGDEEGTWTLSEDGKTLTITIAGEPEEFSVDGDKIFVEMEANMKLIFKK